MNLMQRDLLDLVYPIGRGFIDFTDNDYSNYLGFTWERELMGMFPLGADDTNYKLGAIGGKKSQSLTVNQLPTHKLELSLRGRNQAAGQNSSQGKYTFEVAADAAPNWDINAGYTAESIGKGESFSIMPPYKAVYYWKRVG